MKRQDVAGDWSELGRLAAMAQERVDHLDRLGEHTHAAIAGYWGNTMVHRGADGGILKLICYRADHSLSVWEDGEWVNGRWLLNAGQDNSTICHTLEIDGRLASWCHSFAPYKTVGDRWISPETAGGHPTYPLSIGGVPVVDAEGKTVVEGVGFGPGQVMSLEDGVVQALDVPPSGQTRVRSRLAALGDKTDEGMEGYFGNTMMFKDDAGKVIEVIYYRPDHTMRSWRDGMWVEGQWLINDAQDNSTIFQTREIFGTFTSWCHSFSPYKKIGDRWIAPETRGGHPTYPLTVGGVPVIEEDGVLLVMGTRFGPSLVMSMEEGLVPPEQSASDGVHAPEQGGKDVES
ncbi:hypothetical protein [Paraburkholderia caffeinilytica]|uniref:hypothetical protein n=1 Tax=Paraburkholderia caffeinilytica TaxID=1761016 RepID=UPI003D9FDB52